MTDVRPFDPALFRDDAIDAATAKLNQDMIALLTAHQRPHVAPQFRQRVAQRGLGHGLRHLATKDSATSVWT